VSSQRTPERLRWLVGRGLAGFGDGLFHRLGDFHGRRDSGLDLGFKRFWRGLAERRLGPVIGVVSVIGVSVCSFSLSRSLCKSSS